jgi:serine/threonine protein kinase
MTDGPAPAEGGTVGPYTLVERIGRGGMGEVWRATDDRPGADPAEVAVKVIAADRLDDPEARSRFGREVAAARRVGVDEVAAVVGADTTADRPWLASRFVDGETLAQHVAVAGPMPEDELRRLGLGLARGLDAIHRAGVVHRDLTPGNVVLGPEGPVIVDFGVSRIDDVTTITRAGALVGTPAWMAPEQLRDDRVSEASDIWAWGAVMAYAATGRPPVSGERTETVIARVLDGAVDLEAVPDWLAPPVTAALDAEPARRPTADELVARFDRTGRGTAATAVTRADPVTRVASDHVQPTAADPGPAPDPEPARDWGRPAVRAAVLVGGVIVGLLVPALLGVILATVGILGGVALRVWTEERRDGVAPTVNAATVLVASVLLLATSLSSVLGFGLAVVAVIALIALFVTVGGDIG